MASVPMDPVAHRSSCVLLWVAASIRGVAVSMCANCDDKGIIRLNWSDAPDDFAICLCAVGLDMRGATHQGKKRTPLWHVWCAREQVDPSRVYRVEDVLSADDMAARGLTVKAEQDRESRLFAAGRTKK